MNIHFHKFIGGTGFRKQRLSSVLAFVLLTSLFLMIGPSKGFSQVEMLTIEQQKNLCREALTDELDGYRKEQKSQFAVAEAKRREMTINYCRQRLGLAASIRLNSDKEVCQSALNLTNSKFDDRPQFSQDVAEAKRRKLSVDACISLVQARSSSTQKTAEKSSQSKVKGAGDENYRKKEIQTLCRVSLNSDKDDWDNSNPNFANYVNEVMRRGYTVEWCRVALGLPRLEFAKSKPVQPSLTQTSISEIESRNKLYQNLMIELEEFVKSEEPSTDHIVFSMTVSKFRAALGTNDESLKKNEYDKLQSVLVQDLNFQKYRDGLEQKRKRDEQAKQNQIWAQIKLRADFISDYLKRDPLNRDANDLGQVYIKLIEILKSKDESKVSALENEAEALFERLHLKPIFMKSIQAKGESGSQVETISSSGTTLNPTSPEAPPSPSLAIEAPQLKKVALVIGNSSYRFVPKLENPSRDTDLIAKTLRDAGFATVIQKVDLSREQMITAIQEFALIADASDWSIIYFAGHGIELGGTNYIIPVDAKLKADRDIEIETVNLAQISRSIEGAKKLKMIILDACRDNPFASQMKRTIASRSIGRGLATVEPEAGTLVVYAAKNGEIAYDGEGENSPFAKALVRRIQQKPALEIRRLIDFVRDDVLEATSKKQQPFSYGSLPANEDYYFLK